MTAAFLLANALTTKLRGDFSLAQVHGSLFLALPSLTLASSSAVLEFC